MCKLYKDSILFYLFFISIICKIVEYKYGIVNEKLHVVSFAEIFWYFTCKFKTKFETNFHKFWDI